MAAGLGFKTFTTGEVLTAADTNGYLMQGINVFASTAARDAAITSPQEGQFAFTKDTNGLWYYDGAAWVASGATGDIEGVTAGVGISGGGTSGTVTVTNSMATAIDAKGDLVPGTGADTFARLAVGTNGQVLTADSTAATGLAWATASGGSTNMAGKNGQINSAMNVWQRGTSVAVASSTNTTYTADRYIYNVGANQASTVSRQATGDTTNLPFIQYCARVQRNASQTGTGTTYFISNWETINSIPFAGKTVTFSFYARAGANYSATSSTMTYKLVSGTGTDQNESTSGFTGATNVVSQSAVLTTTWQRFSYSGTVASTATQLATEFLSNWSGTAGANDYYEVTGVQVEIAASASAYSPNTSTYQAELAACQRYYIRYLGTSNNFAFFGSGTNKDTTNAYITVSLPVEMRVKPTSVDTVTAADYRLQYGATGFTLTTLALGTVGDGTKTGSLYATVASGLTTSGFVQLLGNNNSTAYVGFSAEL